MVIWFIKSWPKSIYCGYTVPDTTQELNGFLIKLTLDWLSSQEVIIFYLCDYLYEQELVKWTLTGMECENQSDNTSPQLSLTFALNCLHYHWPLHWTACSIHPSFYMDWKWLKAPGYRLPINVWNMHTFFYPVLITTMRQILSRVAKAIHCAQNVKTVRLCTEFNKSINNIFLICHILWHFQDGRHWPWEFHMGQN